MKDTEVFAPSDCHHQTEMMNIGGGIFLCKLSGRLETLHFYLNINPGWQIQIGQGINGFGRDVNNVN